MYDSRPPSQYLGFVTKLVKRIQKYYKRGIEIYANEGGHGVLMQVVLSYRPFAMDGDGELRRPQLLPELRDRGAMTNEQVVAADRFWGTRSLVAACKEFLASDRVNEMIYEVEENLSDRYYDEDGSDSDGCVYSDY